MEEKTIIIVNQGDTTNYGDIAINQTLKKFFEDNKYIIEYVSFWSERNIFGEKYNNLIKKIVMRMPVILDCLNRIVIKRTLRGKRYDAIVIGGGELLCGHRGFNSSLYMWTKIAHKKNIPVFLYGVSGDTEMPKKLKLRNKKSLYRCSYIWTRDNNTNYICKNLYNCSNVETKPDVVFAYNHVYNLKNKSNKNKNLDLYVPINFNKQLQKNMNFNSCTDYYEYLISIVEKNGRDIIITSTAFVDEAFSKNFYEYAKKRLKKYKVEYSKYTNLNDYLKLLERVDTVISGRMHALILAIICGCNIKAIPFKTKLRVFEKEYSNIEDVKKIEDNSLDGLNELLTKIEEVKNLKNEK